MADQTLAEFHQQIASDLNEAIAAVETFAGRLVLRFSIESKIGSIADNALTGLQTLRVCLPDEAKKRGVDARPWYAPSAGVYRRVNGSAGHAKQRAEPEELASQERGQNQFQQRVDQSNDRPTMTGKQTPRKRTSSGRGDGCLSIAQAEVLLSKWARWKAYGLTSGLGYSRQSPIKTLIDYGTRLPADRPPDSQRIESAHDVDMEAIDNAVRAMPAELRKVLELSFLGTAHPSDLARAAGVGHSTFYQMRKMAIAFIAGALSAT